MGHGGHPCSSTAKLSARLGETFGDDGLQRVPVGEVDDVAEALVGRERLGYLATLARLMNDHRPAHDQTHDTDSIAVMGVRAMALGVTPLGTEADEADWAALSIGRPGNTRPAKPPGVSRAE